MLAIEELGNRICIIGCSSSGKSTLGTQLSRKLNIAITHLDLLAHHHDSQWKRKPDSELIDAHNKIIQQKNWIIEGNYSICMQHRIENATAVIWLDFHVLTSAARYLKRCMFANEHRPGNLPGSEKQFAFWLLKHILFTYPQKRPSYQTIIDSAQAPAIRITSMKALQQAKRYWQL